MKRWPYERTTVLSLSVLSWSAQSCYQPSRSADDLSGYTGQVVGDDSADDNDGDSQGDDESGSDHAGNGDGDGDADQGGDGDGTSDDSGDGAGDDDSTATDDGSDSEDAGTVVEPPPRPTSLSFSVLTVSLDGRYSPRNVGAIWIEDGSGRFVKTLEEWARNRERYLYTFLDASGGDTTDAITSATLSGHRTHSVTWDLTDFNGSSVSDGDYRVMMEITDHNGEGDTASVPFTKGSSPLEVTPSDESHFVDMSLRYE
jgi:hypothetical protein